MRENRSQKVRCMLSKKKDGKIVEEKKQPSLLSRHHRQISAAASSFSLSLAEDPPRCCSQNNLSCLKPSILLFLSPMLSHSFRRSLRVATAAAVDCGPRPPGHQAALPRTENESAESWMNGSTRWASCVGHADRQASSACWSNRCWPVCLPACLLSTAVLRCT